MLVGLGYGQQRVAGKSAWVRPRKDTLDVDVLMPHEQDYFRYHRLSEKEYTAHTRRHGDDLVSISTVTAGTAATATSVITWVGPYLLHPAFGAFTTFVQLFAMYVGYVGNASAPATSATPVYRGVKKLIPDNKEIKEKFGLQPFALVKYTGTDALRKALVPAKGFAYE
jgi:hypothetical protein